MKKNTLLLLLINTLWLGSCDITIFPKGDRFPVQGRWRIQKISIRLDNGRDSTARDMGYLVFGKCRAADNGIGECSTGLRIYPSGITDPFHFQTMWDYVNKQKRLYLATSITDKDIDLFGNYDINVLTKKEMVFSCKRCYVSKDPKTRLHEYFEVRATRE